MAVLQRPCLAECGGVIFATPDLGQMVIFGRHELVPWNYVVTFPPHVINVCAIMTPSPSRPLLCAQGRSGFTKLIVLLHC
jgi:hypothetical protein